MSYIRLAIAGVVVAALAAAAIAVTSFLKEKDRMVQERDQQILNLKAEVAGLNLDNERLRQSNASLQSDRDRKRDDLARVQVELSKLQVVDAAASKRVNDLERKLNDRERLDQVERLRNSRRAELVLRVVNRSAKCELENFFEAGGACKNGVWVKEGGRVAPPEPVAQTPAEPQPAGGTRASQ